MMHHHQTRLEENMWKVGLDMNRKIGFLGDSLKTEIRSPKGRVKPLSSNSKFISDRVIEGGKYELKKILEAHRNEKGEGKFLCRWRGFDSSQKNWEPPHSLVHG